MYYSVISKSFATCLLRFPCSCCYVVMREGGPLFHFALLEQVLVLLLFHHGCAIAVR